MNTKDSEGQSRKRKAEDEVLLEPEQQCNVGQASVVGKEDVAPDNVTPASAPAPTGFAAFAKSNPFLAAASGAKSGFGFGGIATSGFGFGFGTITQPAFPSPKSPKPNPFSSPSPAHNPFMTIENQDELWQRMAQDKLSDEEAAKLTLTLPVVKKPRLTSGERESESSVAPEEAQSDLAPTEKKKEDEEQEENGAEEENDEDGDAGERSPGKLYTTYALPENVVVVTGEEQDECLLQTRAKLYRLGVKSSSSVKSDCEEDESSPKENAARLDLSAVEWVEVGVGPVKVLRQKEQQSSESKNESEKTTQSTDLQRLTRLVIRREDKKGGIGTKLLMNVRLDQYVSVTQHGDKTIRLICVNSSDPSLQLAPQKAKELQTYLLRTKTVQDAKELTDLLMTCIAATKSDGQ